MENYKNIYGSLNQKQKQAVDKIFGSLLVIAGPGTGKTQLLSTRVANILRKTDTLASNILCLTFTESGAQNMLDRLVSIIGDQAYEINISTYHAFGSELITRHRDYFGSRILEKPIDELSSYKIFSEIFESLRYDDLLKNGDFYYGSVVSRIKQLKENLISPDDFGQIVESNMQLHQELSPIISEIIGSININKKTVSKFEDLLIALSSVNGQYSANNLFVQLIVDLKSAIVEYQSSSNTKSITSWKNTWLEKNNTGVYVLNGQKANLKLKSLAEIYRQYDQKLSQSGFYDYADMILECVKTIGQNLDLRYNLLEKYQFVLLDEFQDTNKSQLKLVELITCDPNEGGVNSNVMAVGDDDQTIFAFAGAEHSNMTDFLRLYSNPEIICLTDNYRSHQRIIDISNRIAQQIDTRLVNNFSTKLDKQLIAKNQKFNQDYQILRHHFVSDVSEYSYITSRIKTLIDNGVNPSEIAVISAKHQQLENITPYLKHNQVPLTYEKRENVLQDEHIRFIIDFLEIVVASQNHNKSKLDYFIPRIISNKCFEFTVVEIWDFLDATHEQKIAMIDLLLVSDNPVFRMIGMMIATLGVTANTASAEQIIDMVIGLAPIDTGDDTIRSPFYDYYLKPKNIEAISYEYYVLLRNLRILRTHIGEYQKNANEVLTTEQFLHYLHLLQLANINILNKDPHQDHVHSVKLLTAHKSKGLEFEHVFLISLHQDSWGLGKGSNNYIALTNNLKYIEPNGATDDDRRRLFFVAVTRAKNNLYMTSHASNYIGKQFKPVRYLTEESTENGLATGIIPEDTNLIEVDEPETIEPNILQAGWQWRHLQSVHIPDIKEILKKEKLKNLTLTASLVNQFIDLKDGGPESVLLQHILHFPRLKTTSQQYGTAVHKTLEFVSNYLSENNKLPDESKWLNELQNNLRINHFQTEEYEIFSERGAKAISCYINQFGDVFEKDDMPEYSFSADNCHINGTKITGNADKLKFDKLTDSIIITDYKTGKGGSKWEYSIKHLKYKNQLYFYSFLIESSPRFQKYQFGTGTLDFVEPDVDGQCHRLILKYQPKEAEFTKKLCQAVAYCLKNLDFPDTAMFSKDVSGIKKFMEYLVDNYYHE